MVQPYKHSALSKKEQVAQMFDNIALRYDLLNHLLSLGIDKGWRKKLITLLKREKPQQVLDVATGTAEVAIATAQLPATEIIGIDISVKMLALGKEKILKKKLQNKISLQHADCENLPFAANRFDAITVAFGVRNFENLSAGLLEMYRVLKPGGTALILEFSSPQNFPVKQLYQFYSKNILPKIGKSISGDSAAYSYLPESVKEFPSGNKFISVFEEAGFSQTKIYTLTFGIASIYYGKK